MDWSLEYDAPQFVDFTKVGCDEFANREDYFNIDHESLNATSQSVTGNMADQFGSKLDQNSFNSLSTTKLNGKNTNVEILNDTMNRLNISQYKIKSEPVISAEINNHVAECKENILDSHQNSSKLAPDCLSQMCCNLDKKNMEDSGVSLPTSNSELFESPRCSGKEKNYSDGSKDPLVFSSDANQLKDLKIMLSKLGSVGKKKSSQHRGNKELLKSNQHSTPNKSPDCRGRKPLRQGCRQVAEVSSAKKRLSMSVDRGRDRLRLLSPSPERERSLERKRIPNDKFSEVRLVDSKKFGSALLLQKLHSAASSQIIREELNENDFVKEITGENVSLVEEEKASVNGLVPHTGVPFQPQGSHRVTFPKPFSFEERTRTMLMKKEQKIKKILNEEKKAREFHARPFPDIIYSGVNPKKVKPQLKPPTKPLPFNLHEPHLNQKLAVEELKPTFHAKPANVLQKEPFIPLKTSRPATEFAHVSLSTEQRAAQRAEWERQKREKLARTEQERLEKERQHQEHEGEELRRLRAARVHRANPIRHYKPISVVPSGKPATIPKSPKSARK